jgi:hypothetical protein
MIDKVGAFIFLTIFFFIVSCVGGYWNFEVSGGLQTASISGQPGILTFLGWVFSTMGFMFSLCTFQVSGLPLFFSAIFDVAVIIWVILLVIIVRGN